MTDHTADRTVEQLLGPFSDYLGLRFESASGSEVAARWTVRPDFHQPHGIIHGGVHSSVVETLASTGAALWYGERGKVVGVSNQTDFYRPVGDGELISTGQPVHQGRSQQVWVIQTRDDQDRLVARGQVRLQHLPWSR